VNDERKTRRQLARLARNVRGAGWQPAPRLLSGWQPAAGIGNLPHNQAASKNIHVANIWRFPANNE
jgi:hypothetical protein